MRRVRMVLPVCLLLVSTAGASAADRLPNILFLLADDLGYGDVGAFNPESRIPTPRLDRLAAEGMMFTDAHSGGSVCVPSRYALLTGRFAVRAKLNVRSGPVIEEDRMTIASLLQEHGYATAMVGKWHLGFDPPPQGDGVELDESTELAGGPVDRGFGAFFGMHASLDIPPYFYIWDRGALMPPNRRIRARDSLDGDEGWNQIQGAFWREGAISRDFKHEEVTPRFIAEAIEVVQGHAEHEPDRPLFLYLALPSPHTPWLPSKEFRGQSGAGMYGDFVMQVDAGIGELLEALEETGLAEESLVFFSSDNGPVWYEKDVERFGHRSTGPLRGMKASPWEGGHRVPFIARWPGEIKPGTTSSQTIVFSDMFATLAELCGREALPEGAAEDSVSFLSYLRDAERKAGARPPIVHDRRTLRDGDWKLILPRKSRPLGGGGPSTQYSGELYNLAVDLAEEQNRFTAEPERAAQMTARLKEILARDQ